MVLTKKTLIKNNSRKWNNSTICELRSNHFFNCKIEIIYTVNTGGGYAFININFTFLSSISRGTNTCKLVDAIYTGSWNHKNKKQLKLNLLWSLSSAWCNVKRGKLVKASYFGPRTVKLTKNHKLTAQQSWLISQGDCWKFWIRWIAFLDRYYSYMLLLTVVVFILNLKVTVKLED